jgi:hypothetical protein
MSDATGFRRIALGMKGAVEGAHRGHSDFRVKGKIFATLHADPRHGTVKLTLEQQHDFIKANSAAFRPESGAWGRQGYTRVRLASVDDETLGEALTVAWQNVARSNTTTGPKPRRR